MRETPSDFAFMYFVSIQNPDREFLLRVSYMEIYNERINDLLGDKAGLDVHEDPEVR
mgnify:CR=1 FL=1